MMQDSIVPLCLYSAEFAPKHQVRSYFYFFSAEIGLDCMCEGHRLLPLICLGKSGVIIEDFDKVLFLVLIFGKIRGGKRKKATSKRWLGMLCMMLIMMMILMVKWTVCRSSALVFFHISYLLKFWPNFSFLLFCSLIFYFFFSYSHLRRAALL